MKSGRSPPQVKNFIQFEDDLIRTVKELKFSKVKNDFQKLFGEDMKKVQTSKKTLTPADKTFIMYKLNTITTTYKKASKNIGTKISKEGLKFAKQANILGKIEMNNTGNYFVTLKDYKENFMNRPTTSLINPSKKRMKYEEQVSIYYTI